jgi:hypothetical protein
VIAGEEPEQVVLDAAQHFAVRSGRNSGNQPLHFLKGLVLRYAPWRCRHFAHLFPRSNEQAEECLTHRFSIPFKTFRWAVL